MAEEEAAVVAVTIAEDAEDMVADAAEAASITNTIHMVVEVEAVEDAAPAIMRTVEVFLPVVAVAVSPTTNGTTCPRLNDSKFMKTVAMPAALTVTTKTQSKSKTRWKRMTTL